MRRLIRAVLPAVVIILGGAHGATATVTPSGYPGAIPPVCGAYYPGDCLITTRLGGFSISPHLAHAGHDVTGTVSEHCTDANNAPCPIDWSAFLALGRKVGGCGATTPSCTVHIPNSPQSEPYTAINIGINNNQGTGYSSDYVAIAGKGTVVVSGRVTDEQSGAASPGVGVRAVCASGGTTITDATGRYSLIVNRGPCTFKALAPAGQAAVPAQIALTLSHNVSGVDFSLGTGSLHITLAPETTSSDGAGIVQGTITDLDATGAPIAGQTIAVSPPLQVDEGQPRVLVCDAANRLVYPKTLSDGTLLGAHFTRTTDSAGQVQFTAYVGTTPGLWYVDADEVGSHPNKHASATLSIGAGSGPTQLPVELSSLLLAAGNNTLANFSQSGLQNALDWLGALKFGGGPGSGALTGIDFAPIWGIDRTGAVNAGVVLFASAPSVRSAVLSYLDGTSTVAPPEAQAVVIDIANMQELLFGTYLAGQSFTAPPFRLPSLDQWANGTVIQIAAADVQTFHNNTHIPVPARGTPHLGYYQPTGAENLLYGLGPYPPFGAGQTAVTNFRHCVTGPSATTITIHSPLSLLVHGPGGAVAGVNAHGRPVDTIRGAIVHFKGRRVLSVQLPPGRYGATLTGTGDGPATVDVSSGGSSHVYLLRVRTGEKGSLSISGSRAGTMRFGGHAVHPASGLALRVGGTPHRLRHSRPGLLTLHVRNPFGQPAAGATVRLGRATTLVNASGVARLPYGALHRGRVTLTISGAGLKTYRVSIRVT